MSGSNEVFGNDIHACPRCEGRGYDVFYSYMCELCSGSGIVEAWRDDDDNLHIKPIVIEPRGKYTYKEIEE